MCCGSIPSLRSSHRVIQLRLSRIGRCTISSHDYGLRQRGGVREGLRIWSCECRTSMYQIHYNAPELLQQLIRDDISTDAALLTLDQCNQASG